jgi:hypothetical protein
MSPVALSSLLTIAALGVSLATAQITGTYPAVPLASKHYDSPAALVCISFVVIISKVTPFAARKS